MPLILLKPIVLFFIRKYAKDAVVEGAKAIVASTDNTIDDELMDAFLGEAVKSKGNGLTPKLRELVIGNSKIMPKQGYKSE